MCPWINRSQKEVDSLYFRYNSARDTREVPIDISHLRNILEEQCNQDVDRQSANTDVKLAEGKIKKYQIKIEIRSSNEDVSDIMRNDIESIVHFLGQGYFIMGQ